MHLESPYPTVQPAVVGRTVLTIAIASLFIVIVRHAWLSDDAYITLRSLDNWINGHGLVYNVGERVQSYTHPLWLFLVAIPYSLTHEPYFTMIVTSIVVTMAALSIFVSRVAPTPSVALYGLLALGSSKAFVDYSTSGLENPLTYLLLACYGWVYLKTDLQNRDHFILSFICALGMLNRLDSALLFLPPLLYSLWYRCSWRRCYLTAIGFIPIIGWTIFSLIYYGFLLPNTAYAKLNTGIPQSELWRQGVSYYLDSLTRDPITLATIFMVSLLIMLDINCAFFKRHRTRTRMDESGYTSLIPRLSALVRVPFIFFNALTKYSLSSRGRRIAGIIGIALYLLYIARIGGDFMSGRFLAAPCFFAILLWPKPTGESVSAILIPGILLFLGLSSPYPTWSSPFKEIPRDELITERGIADERAYYRNSWFLAQRRVGDDFSVEAIHNKRQRQGLEAQHGEKKILAVEAAGLRGYYAGPTVYVLDELALSDPLLARLPAKRDTEWRVGHYQRIIPDGYLETLDSGNTQLADQNLADYYDQLSLIVGGKLWEPARWQAIWAMNSGASDHLVDVERYRYPSVQALSIQDMAQRPTQGEPWLHPEMLVASDSGVIINVDDAAQANQFVEVNVASHNRYQLRYLRDQEIIATQLLAPTYFPPAAFYTHRLEIPDSARTAGFNRLHLLPQWSPNNLDGFLDDEVEEIERADIFTIGQVKLY